MIRFALFLLLTLAHPLHAACRQALVLGLDISGSVDEGEYRQQLDGVAGALSAPAVQSALLAMPGAHVELAVFEWAGPQDQRILLPWTTLDSPNAIIRAAAILRATGRHPADPSTAIGAALEFADTLLSQRPACWHRVFDISGDGTSNSGPRPQDIRTDAKVTVNALVVGAGDGQMTDMETLPGYFTANVIRGPEAFVELAMGYDDYRAAIERKLLRELQVFAIGELHSGADTDNDPPQVPNK